MSLMVVFTLLLDRTVKELMCMMLLTGTAKCDASTECSDGASLDNRSTIAGDFISDFNPQ